MAYEPDMAIVFDSVTKAVIVSFRGATVYLPGPMLTEGGRPYRRSALPPTWLARLIATSINDPQRQIFILSIARPFAMSAHAEARCAKLSWSATNIGAGLSSLIIDNVSGLCAVCHKRTLSRDR
ncbi:hypothetical protein [Rhizobium leguminosarum]|uniref:hypothetical protein n=1 Tax=Rhizobium leguminosarum TaxID=384 RepID=UPI001C915C47|nr:hypothetical protein [Rhizobium leguminosarum]MBY2911330.1 hypothetical protein [Rhizobium leguminosarum]MBY2917602.1 hypothetical protein [Rhizobium leguminosarum]MBY2926663.1 hypothetical protein [Rhizobium leguminosarum]MBY2937963.1 hypothetical protein [Rhizobium leguminosarum]MBY2952124.1 hypothetical protein [Rhizobium leguminosarum]